MARCFFVQQGMVRWFSLLLEMVRSCFFQQGMAHYCSWLQETLPWLGSDQDCIEQALAVLTQRHGSVARDEYETGIGITPKHFSTD